MEELKTILKKLKNDLAKYFLVKKNGAKFLEVKEDTEKEVPVIRRCLTGESRRTMRFCKNMVLDKKTNEFVLFDRICGF